ncbi:MAG: hypothetical protein RLZZ46_818 [Bacteroidota bacterium]
MPLNRGIVRKDNIFSVAEFFALGVEAYTPQPENGLRAVRGVEANNPTACCCKCRSCRNAPKIVESEGFEPSSKQST